MAVGSLDEGGILLAVEGTFGCPTRGDQFVLGFDIEIILTIDLQQPVITTFLTVFVGSLLPTGSLTFVHVEGLLSVLGQHLFHLGGPLVSHVD